MAPLHYFEANPLSVLTGTGNRLALFLDFDGTLVPIQKGHDRPCLSPAMGALLESIAGSRRSVVAIISGRSLADLRKRAPVPGVVYAGSHGLEISGPGVRFVHKEARAARVLVDAVRGEVEKEIGGCTGIAVERKPYSFAVHYRSAGREAMPFLRRCLREKIVQSGNQGLFTITAGKKVFEVAPRLSWNKGASMLYLMSRMSGEYLSLCIGDDRTDETLFDAFRDRGITVRVGLSRRTAARYYVKGQSEVCALLKGIREALSENAAAINTAGPL